MSPGDNREADDTQISNIAPDDEKLGDGDATLTSVNASTIEDDIEEMDRRCGYGPWKPKWMQRFNTPFCLLVAICFYVLVEGTIVLGLIYVNMAPLERRYEYSGVQTAWIASTQDVMGAVTALVVGYLGTIIHKGRLITLGAGFFTLGCLLFMLPQFIGDSYSLGTFNFETCDIYGNATDCSDAEPSRYGGFYAIFLLAQLCNGFAGSSLYTVAVPYLDDNVKTKNTPVYIGVLYAISALGTTVGYVLGAYFLSIYVDVWRVDMDDITIKNTDPRWVGAWWMGFIPGAIGGVISIAVMGWWPRELPSAVKYRSLRRSQSHKGTEIEEIKEGSGVRDVLRDLWMQTKVLLLNPAYVCLIVGGIFESGIIIAFTVYLPKIVQFQFVKSTTEAGIVAGAILVPAAAIGQVCGGLIAKKLDLKLRGLIIQLIVTSVAVCLIAPVLLLRCPTPHVAGVFVDYNNRSVYLDTPELTQLCNEDCQCTTQSYDPVCGSNGIEYFSPCHAGCLTSDFDDKTYGQCGCIPGNVTSIDAVGGICEADCYYFYIFLFFFFIIVFLVFAGATAAMSASMRVVPDKSRTYASGINSTMSRLFGTVPFPILLGSIFDRNCVVWQDNCGQRGSCWIYDTEALALGLFLTGIGCKAVATAFYFIAFFTYKPPEEDDQKEIIFEVNKTNDTSGADKTVGESECTSQINEGYQDDNFADDARFTRF